MTYLVDISQYKSWNNDQAKKELGGEEAVGKRPRRRLVRLLLAGGGAEHPREVGLFRLAVGFRYKNRSNSCGG